MNSTLATPVHLEAADDGAPAELAALLAGVGVALLDEIGWLRVMGSDRVRWLNGMVTNAIQPLAPGQGCYNFVLNAQGRIQGDLNAFAQPDSLLLETPSAGRLATLFDRFIIMDDVGLAILRNGRSEIEAPEGIALAESSDRSGILVAGPHALAVLAKLGLPDVPEMSMVAADWQGQAVEIVHAHSPLVPRYEVWAEASVVAEIHQALLDSGAVECGELSVEWLRILEGTPRYGIDIRDRELPQETGQTRALHFSKGCYLGQEIVERIHSRGNVHRTFGGFELHGALPEARATLEQESKAVGELTSVATIPLAGRTVQIALGYIRREALDRGLPIEFAGGIAKPVPLPYTVPVAI
jgi:aminomethyltransferase